MAVTLPNATSVLRILLVDDSALDVNLIARGLRATPRQFEVRRVASERELRAEIVAFRPDAVLIDDTAPGFSGVHAFQAVREWAPSVPFIYISGAIDEQAAAQSLQQDTVDHVLENNLARLPGAVRAAVEATTQHAARGRADLALVESESRFQTIIESTGDWVWETDTGHALVFSNKGLEGLLGERSDLRLGRSITDMREEADQEPMRRFLDERFEARSGWRRRLARWRHADGSVRWLESTAEPRVDAHGRLIGFRGIDRDVTQRQAQDAKIRQLARFHALLSALGKAIPRARELTSLLFDTCALCVDAGHFVAALIRMPDENGHLRIVASAGDVELLRRIATLAPGDGTTNSYRQQIVDDVFATGHAQLCFDATAPELPGEVREEMARRHRSARDSAGGIATLGHPCLVLHHLPRLRS